MKIAFSDGGEFVTRVAFLLRHILIIERPGAGHIGHEEWKLAFAHNQRLNFGEGAIFDFQAEGDHGIFARVFADHAENANTALNGVYDKTGVRKENLNTWQAREGAATVAYQKVITAWTIRIFRTLVIPIPINPIIYIKPSWPINTNRRALIEFSIN